MKRTRKKRNAAFKAKVVLAAGPTLGKFARDPQPT
jgi:hypothetical protein